ncbi:SAGA HAT/Core module component [Cadophora gregata]|nr:SAGA HAT/Core module component [Cadophora gregata]KAK0111749.1 SAGA HAT/Core module component [Cadophora gregata]
MSARRGAARNGTRGGSDDNVINRQDIAEEIRRHVNIVAEAERKAKSLKDKIIVQEQHMRKKKEDGIGISISDHHELEALYRESVKIAEEQKVRGSDESILTRLGLLADVQRRAEQEEERVLSARNSTSRNSGIDFDGPSDSPVPSPADNRHVRKIGGSRTSSQPPRSNTDKLDGTASEASERASKPKIMYSLKEEVAFKRKLPGGKPEDQDWIQGEVVRVIGEGKSRRYDVKDIDPDAVEGNNIYKSSASQMVPIPPEGTPLGDYEPGKQVLALYPAATTFYRAQVKSMVDGGTRVLVLFEEEDVEKSIARRFVLDHRG